MTATRPILVLAASAGAGHITAGRAVAQALRSRAPDESVEVLDMLQFAGALFRRLYGKGYDDLVRLLPEAWAWFHDTTDRPRSYPGHRLLHAAQNLGTRPMLDHLVRLRPKLIVNTHFLAAEIVALARRRGVLNCPQGTVLTDFEAHRLWVQEPTERYYVATARAKEYLVVCGARATAVQITGIPVRAGFEARGEPRELRQQLGLRSDVPVVLLLASAGGVRPSVEFLQQLLNSSCDFQVVAVAGRLAQLREELAALKPPAGRAVRVLGFTEEMHRWMQAADLVVTKPGGLTVAEALTAHLPIVIVNPLAGQEQCNSDYLLTHGAAVKVNKPELLGYEVEQLLKAPERLQAMRTAAAALSRPHAAQEIAADVLGLLGR
jgi:processive 1,2-diacylglycerol beta-glucosyltransferase